MAPEQLAVVIDALGHRAVGAPHAARLARRAGGPVLQGLALIVDGMVARAATTARREGRMTRDRPCPAALRAHVHPQAAAAAEERGATAHRQRLLEGLRGTVVEIGAGHGLNFPSIRPTSQR